MFDSDDRDFEYGSDKVSCVNEKDSVKKLTELLYLGKGYSFPPEELADFLVKNGVRVSK